MARGKYSPTVSEAYYKDQDWFRKFSNGEQYDPDGYDAYGYDKNDVDRAGHNEFDYLHDDDYDSNFAYDDTAYVWGFDGTKPVLKY